MGFIIHDLKMFKTEKYIKPKYLQFRFYSEFLRILIIWSKVILKIVFKICI